MKKLLAFLCALTLVLSLAVTAYAKDISGSSGDTATGTQRIYTETKPLTWIMEIPSDCHIPFQTTTRIDVGDVKIKDVSWDVLENEHMILAYVSNTGKLTSSSGDSISYRLIGVRHWGNGAISEPELIGGTTYPDEVAKYQSKTDVGLNYYNTLQVEVDSNEWFKAVGGRTYEEKVTYTSRYKSARDF